MKQEYWLSTIVGLIIFAVVLDLIVNPLTIALPTPYHFLVPQAFMIYPLTSFSIALKAAAIILVPLLLLSFAGWSKLIKGIIIFVVSGVLQLYALQDVATGAHSIPLEWAISFTLAGILLLIPALIYFLVGVVHKTNVIMVGEESQDYIVKDKDN